MAFTMLADTEIGSVKFQSYAFWYSAIVAKLLPSLTVLVITVRMYIRLRQALKVSRRLHDNNLQRPPTVCFDVRLSFVQ